MDYIPLGKGDFDGVNWQDVISGCDQKECLKYSMEFFRKAKEEKSESNLQKSYI